MRKGYFFLMGFCLLLAVMLPGCPSMPTEYVEADELTYDAVSGPYSAYYEADETLTEEQKQSKRDVLLTWKLRIAEAKKRAK